MTTSTSIPAGGTVIHGDGMEFFARAAASSPLAPLPILKHLVSDPVFASTTKIDYTLAPRALTSQLSAIMANQDTAARQTGKNAARGFLFFWVAVAILYSAIELWLPLATKLTHREPFPNDAIDESILGELMAQYPVAVTISPDASLLLLKTRLTDSFELEVFDCATGHIIAKSQSRDNQVGLSWRPNNRAVAYFAAEGGNGLFRPYLWDVTSGKVNFLRGPPTSTPIPRFRWSEDGLKLAYLVGGSDEGFLELLDLRPNGRSTVFAGPFRVRSDFRWSWDGRNLAVVQSDSPSTLTILNLDTHQPERKIPIIGGSGEIRDLAWRANTESLALTARTSEFLKLITVDTTTNKVTTCLEAKGDVGEPHYSPDGQTLIYQVMSESAQTLYMTHCDGAPSRRIGPSTGFVNFDRFMPSKSAVAALYTSLTDPPAIYEYSVNSNRERQIYRLPKAEELKSSSPTVINIRSWDGTLVPTVFWRPSDDAQLKRVIIGIHGGPHLQAMKRWEILPHIATERGIGVLAVNYRGSSGYGLTYERRGTARDRVADIIAACNYAHAILGIPNEKIFLFGTSYGAYLAALTANQEPTAIGGVVLVSIVREAGLPIQTGKPHFPVAAFQGENDIGANPDVARQFLESLFGNSVFADPRHCWRVFAHEGHVFSGTHSWAVVYSKLIHMILSTATLKD